MTYLEDGGYLALLDRCLAAGSDRTDRTGVGMRELWAPDPLRFDLSRESPRLTVRYIPFRPARYEACWLLSGQHNASWLEKRGVGIWSSWGDPETRELGPVYGAQLRGTAGSATVDQLARVCRGIREEPHSRRLYWNLWNPADIDDMALPPCHLACQFNVAEDTRQLNMILYMRSADLMLGLPADLNMYAIVQTAIARYTGLTPGRLTVMIGSAHIYRNMVTEARTLVQESLMLPLPGPVTITDDAPLFPGDLEPHHVVAGKGYKAQRPMPQLYRKVAV